MGCIASYKEVIDRGEVKEMKARDLIIAVCEERLTGWKNSDLYPEVQELLERIADHYDICEECRDAFDDMGYEQETLKEMEQIFMDNIEFSKWDCF